ncbi:hypothetical protein B0T17DRAFT_481659 [Bombardia bombarda]|uniref:ATPase synthesis protein 25 n=1 Tax=Bombardia bombarda TaxID=252184 RepID=A0AA40CGW7_9PEZI|nr:hypothetical protein B0T17DRAFT_481659 [Bombardia bombarda]
MGAAPALRAAASCSACRGSALRLFVNSFTSTRTSTRTSQASAARPLFPSSAARYSTFRATPRLCSGPAIEERIEDDAVTQQDGQQHLAADSESSSSDVPWYLEVEPPRHPTLIQEPPPLPDIPEGAPRLVEPLLKFVSDELGLDELKMLDLRELDPPPALGPELLMLLGTARSERHLHVSADRLVRWLRGRGISCKADGLLGRNELKIRLRRKARKAKLLGNAGVARGGDDGITTGWICVNLGTVGWSDQEMELVDDQGRPSGFGVPQSGTTIVVQMMIDSRREELDLEKLWSGILRRSLEKTDKLDSIGAPEKSHFISDPNLPKPRRGKSSRGGAVPSDRRFFSTSARQAISTPDHSILAQILGSLSLRDNDAIANASYAVAHNTTSKLHLLGQLRQFLENLPASEVGKQLTPDQDGNPPTFLRLFNRAIKDLPPSDACEARLWLELNARLHHHADLGDLTTIRTYFKELQLAGVRLPRATNLALLRAIYARPGMDDAVVREQSVFAMEVVDAMFLHGQTVLDHDVIVTVIESLVAGGSQAPEAQRLLAQFEDMLLHAQGDTCPREDLLIRLLDTYGAVQNWQRFWAVFQMPPRYLQRRSQLVYLTVYRRFLELNHQLLAMECLRRCMDEMVHEDPSIAVTGPLLRVLKALILVADPMAEHAARSISPNNKTTWFLPSVNAHEKGETRTDWREFVKYWRRLPE